MDFPEEGSALVDSSTITILNVDDRDGSRYAVSRVLKRAGFAVKEAATGAEALRLAAEQPDLIILDVNLPDINGVEVCRRLKADPATAPVPVLYLSATALETLDKVQGLEAGADAYLAGRVEPSELLATVRALLRTRQAEQALRERARQQAALADIGQRALAGASLPALMDEAASLVVETLGVEYGDILEYPTDGDALVLRSGAGWKPGAVERATLPIEAASQAGSTLLQRAPVVVEDWRREARFPQPPLLREHGVRSGVTVLIDRAGRPFGVLGAHTVRPRPFTVDDVHFLQALANVLALAVERERAETDRAAALSREQAARADAEAAVLRTEHERRIIETLHRIGGMLAAELDLRKLLQLLTDEATALTGAEFGAFFYSSADEQAKTFLPCTLAGAPCEAFTKFPAPRLTPLFSATFHGEAIVRLDDVTADPRYGRNPPFHGMPPGHLPVRSYLAVPVRSRSAKVLGGLFFGHGTAAVFSERHERLMAAVAAQAAVAIDNARLYQEARAAVAARDDFLARASHELRTPLTIIKGHVALLARQLGAKDGETGKLLLVAQRHIDQMTRLITELLDASRLEAGQVILEPAPLDVKAIVAEAAAQALPLAIEKDIRLMDEVPPHLTVVGDALKLELVVVNILTNAVKYTPAGGEIRVQGRWADDSVELRVRDTGAGIAPENLGRIFEPFYQVGSTPGRRKAAGEGVGLGLAIVKRLVDLHGGRVWAESEGPERGSTFVVILPRAQPGQQIA